MGLMDVTECSTLDGDFIKTIGIGGVVFLRNGYQYTKHRDQGNGAKARPCSKLKRKTMRVCYVPLSNLIWLHYLLILGVLETFYILNTFHLNICKDLRHKGKTIQDANMQDIEDKEKNKKSRRAKPVEDVRFDKNDHFPEQSDEYSRCTYCKKGLTKVVCLKCQIKVCFVEDRNCFYRFHHEK